MKRRLVVGFQRYLLNPVAKIVSGRWSVTMLLETTGRRTGKPRRVPVGFVRRASVVFVVSEHGRAAAYVRNIQADPRVRLRLAGRWHEGRAQVRSDLDPEDVLADMHPLSAVPHRLASTDPLVVEIQLASEASG